ncbi:hypothetical protein EOA79_25125 [Mesorhizobium sp. M1A.F.Ca.IN.020.03.2.1]|uniref:hypothetical protein n=1 Tax=Mesorhizobium sp. M1A.F.Ca.IN.020.03.2.1 TaxID=2496769 RepID=UPI000FD47E99|nr:hypothetical protein [Mesorhizobium sp. M1A.F.Ca.IN.020.03.2.1]RUU97332.1 hypothetical protein EOA79_25125 [Mesorhizobium sp. M1A.F.Ca.IN.020.03.2.1]
MPATAYSVRFARELDVEQLATLMTGVQPTPERDGAELLRMSGDAIRDDIQCSSCGKFGARLVRSARSRASRAVLRQAHFRFVDPNGGDAHHPFCEFYGDDENRSVQGSLLDFGSEKSAETRAVRLLVCKGIEQGIFEQRRIREMRQWFFDLKSASRFTVSMPLEAIPWARALQRHPHYRRWQFHPLQAEMPAFDWKAAAKNQFTEDNLPLFDLLKSIPFDDATWRQASDLARKNHQREVFNATVLQPYYEAAISLCVFVAANGGIDFGKGRPEYFRAKGPPVALLALCALVLFISDWDMNAAIAAFAKLLSAPAPSNLTLGNLIGLNPFHEYAAWRLVVVSAEIAAQSPNGLDYDRQLASTEAALREQHRRWRDEQS